MGHQLQKGCAVAGLWSAAEVLGSRGTLGLDQCLKASLIREWGITAQIAKQSQLVSRCAGTPEAVGYGTGTSDFLCYNCVSHPVQWCFCASQLQDAAI